MMAMAPGVGYDLVVVGTSWGGLSALRTLISGLPDSFQMAVTLVQHRHRDSDHLLRSLLQESSSLRVYEVEDKMPLEHGHIYVAPPNYHTLVEPGHFSLSTEAPVRFSRPSIDVTFSSAADSYTHRTVGIVLTGARANVHPRHYGDELTEAHGLMDEGRDAVMLPLVRAAIERGVPVFGLCKGIQEMNVALGGSLWPEVGELPGRHRHRMPKGCKDPKIVFELRERVCLRPGGELARIVGAESIVTNSLHGQAIRELGQRVIVEGRAADETIEAISIEGARSFAIGVQWHAEYDAENDPVSRALFHAFGEAARARQLRRQAA